MKSSTQVFASLVAALATLSQSAIATPRHVSPQHSIYWQHSPLSASSQATITDSSKGSAVSKSFRVADRAVVIDADAISVGSKNRTTILKCSESKPCIEDLLVIDSYKEIFSSDGKIKAASIVMYNTSYAPTAIEVYNSKGEFKSVDFVDGKKGGFKDLGDFLKTAASGIVEPFACVIGKGYQQCLNDLKNGKYEITKAEKQLKLQSGDVIRISRGSEPARFYAHALQGLDMVDSLISSSEIVKKDPITLKKNFSPELKRKIIEGYIKKKMNDKYTWEMLLKEFGYETNKKAIGNNLDLFNSSLEVAKNIPEDFRKAIIDGTVASKVAGDGLSLLIESASKKASIFLDSALLLSQLTNIYVRSSSSETAYKNPYPLVIAYGEPIKDKTPRVTARFPDEPSSMPISSIPKQFNPSLKKAIVSRFLSEFSDVSSGNWSVAKPTVSFVEVDLDNDGKRETIVLDRRGFGCSNRGCPVKIFRQSGQEKSYNFISSTAASRNGLEVALLPTKSNGWQDLAVQYFSYETRTIDWYAVKFDGKTYKPSSRKLTQVPQNIIVSEKSLAFDLGDFPVLQTAASKPSTSTSDSEDKCLIPTLPGIDVSNVKIVKNISSRDQTIEQYIRKEHADALNYKGSISYSYNKVDLDGDGKPEVLLRVSSSFCGTGGCPIDILKFNGSRYLAVSSSLSWGRYIVTSNQTNGFKDMFYPHFIRNEKTYLLLKSSKQGSYQKVKEYTTNLRVKGTAYLVCGEYLSFSK